MDPRRMAASAARHHGVLLPVLLDEQGVTARQRQYRVATGEWRRLPNGIHVVAAVPETFEMLATAALAALPGAALSHDAAGRLHDLDLVDPAVHLTVVPGGTNRIRGAVVHQARLDPCDLTRRKGCPVTTLDRTLVDLGATLGRNALQRCVEDQLVGRSTTFPRLEQTFVRLARPGRPESHASGPCSPTSTAGHRRSRSSRRCSNGCSSAMAPRFRSARRRSSGLPRSGVGSMRGTRGTR